MKRRVMKCLIVIFSVLVFILPITAFAQNRQGFDDLFPLKSFDRDEFLQLLEKRFGNPYGVDIWAEALKMYNQKLKPFWNHIFPRIPHGGMLNEDQQKYWMKAKERLMSRCYDSVKSYVDTQKELWDFCLKEFEKRKAEHEERREEIEKRKWKGGVKYYPYSK